MAHPAHQTGSFWKHYARHGLLPVLAISAFMVTAEEYGWLHGLETAGLDTFLRGQAERTCDDIVVVEITDDDYNSSFFHANSPLDPTSVLLLVKNLRKGEPAVIGVDLDTTSPAYIATAQKFGNPASWSNVIWSDVPKPIPTVASLPADPNGPPPEESTSKLTPVLGAPPAGDLLERLGIPLYPLDPDGMVRRYRRHFQIGARAYPAFAWAVLKKKYPQVERETEELIINFVGKRHACPVVDAAQFFTTPKPTAAALLKDKIVLLGGRYVAARDEYPTPVDTMAGVELIAQTIESDRRGGIQQSSLIWGIAWDLAAGTTVVALFFYLPFERAFWITLFGVPLVALTGSWVEFRSFGRWISFVPVVIGVLLHQLYDHRKHHRAVVKELEEHRRHVARLRQALKDAGQELPEE